MDKHNYKHSNHKHHHDTRGKNLMITMGLNIFITISQIIGGIWSGSLSLISDAMHNFSDVLSLLISYVAIKIAKLPITDRKTYGYKRIEVIATVINVATLLVISFEIFTSAIDRLLKGEIIIASNTVILLALLSILLNGISVLIIRENSKSSMNIRSSYIHLFSDMLTSIAVLLGGVLMKSFGFFWMDSVISIVISVYLFAISLQLLWKTFEILMDFVPQDIDIRDIQQSIEKFDGIENIHHIHVRRLTDDEIHCQCHIAFNENLRLSEVMLYIKVIKEMLNEDYGINHIVIESEYKPTDKQKLTY